MRLESHDSQGCGLTASDSPTAAQPGVHRTLSAGHSCEGAPAKDAQASRNASPQDSMIDIAEQRPATLADQLAQKSSVAISTPHEVDDGASVTYDVCSFDEPGRTSEHPVSHSRSRSSGGSSYHSGHSSLRSSGAGSENAAVAASAACAMCTPRRMYVRPQSYAVQLQLQQQVWLRTSGTVCLQATR